MIRRDGAAVVVVGGSIAGLCAAIAARRAGARVILLDAAPLALRGGNSRHARNLRIMHEAPSPLFPDRYPAADFLADLMTAAAGAGDPGLMARLVEDSAVLPAWLAAQGVRFQTPAQGGIPWSRKTAFFLGGGTAMSHRLHRTAQDLGVRIHHHATVTALEPGGGIRVSGPEGTVQLTAGAVVVASGGYQANPAWMAEGWGALAGRLVVRGTPYAEGAPLASLFALGAAASGRPGSGHLVAVDGRLTAPDGGIVTRVDGLALGLVIDRTGQRLVEEETITGPTRYARWGQLVAACPEALAYAMWDARAIDRVPLSVCPPQRHDGLESLARALALPAAALERAMTESGRVRIPPFFTVPIRPGITFTSHGVQVEGNGRVLDGTGRPLDGVFAAGMAMAPTVLGTGYLAGAALTIAAVFGRRAGEEAARQG